MAKSYRKLTAKRSIVVHSRGSTFVVKASPKGKFTARPNETGKWTSLAFDGFSLETRSAESEGAKNILNSFTELLQSTESFDVEGIATMLRSSDVDLERLYSVMKEFANHLHSIIETLIELHDLEAEIKALQGNHPTLSRIGQVLDVSASLSRSKLAQLAKMVENSDISDDWTAVGTQLATAMNELSRMSETDESNYDAEQEQR